MKSYPSWKPAGVSFWFDPIVERIEALENDSNVFEEIGEGLEDESPDWVAMCLRSGVTPLRKFVGLDNIEIGVHTKQIGTLVGCKVSLCGAMANAHALFERFSAKQLKQIEAAWGAKELREARKIWKRFATTFKPRADEMRRFGADLANAQSVEEQIKYTMGYVSGVRMMDEVSKVVRKAQKKDKVKRERDAVARGAVLTFAVSNWKMIEANRRKLTWMRLTEMFDEATNYEIPIDEEAFKKDPPTRIAYNRKILKANE